MAEERSEVHNDIDIKYRKVKFCNFSSSSEKNAFFPQIIILDCETNERISLEQKLYHQISRRSNRSKFECKNHVNSVIIKISKTVGMIAKLRYFVPSSVLVNIYNSLILPSITYGLIALQKKGFLTCWCQNLE